MRIMITGACGFLGRNLVRYLEGTEHELVLIDLPVGLFPEKTKEPWPTHKNIFHIDVTASVNTLAEKMQGVDVVVHLANKARIDPSWTDYASYYDVNITGSQNALAAAQKAGVGKFIYVSSSSVYGNNRTTKQKETDSLKPTNPYAVSKMAAEFALTAQAQLGNTHLVIVRPFTMYGDYMDFGPNALVISKFIKAWEKDQPLLLHGGGNQRRDFIHASDAVRGLELIITNSQHGDIFNLGTGQSVSIRDLANVISERQIVTPERPGAVSITEADISKLKALGFKPRIKVIEWLTVLMEELKLKEIIV